MAVCMPETEAVLDLFGEILGNADLLRPAADPWPLGRIDPGTHVTYLCNAEGEKLGAVVTDLNATIYLGGRLVMMPEAGMAERANRLEVDETLTDAVAEIVNMARTVFNRQSGNDHLVPSGTRLLKKPPAVDRDGWMLAPSTRLDLCAKVSFGALRIAIVFR